MPMTPKMSVRPRATRNSKPAYETPSSSARRMMSNDMQTASAMPSFAVLVCLDLWALENVRLDGLDPRGRLLPDRSGDEVCGDQHHLVQDGERIFRHLLRYPEKLVLQALTVLPHLYGAR